MEHLIGERELGFYSSGCNIFKFGQTGEFIRVDSTVGVVHNYNPLQRGDEL